MCHDDDWVKIAMADDSVVVNLLLRLHQPPPSLPPPSYPLQLHWTLRQRRSKSVPRHPLPLPLPLPNTKPHPTRRASPTTPLSWSEATSASGGALDGYEESSRPSKLSLTSRSKVANLNETTITKKSRRKKTLAERKEEENLLLKERRSLKNELASLRLAVDKHRATNERLKKLKLDLESRQNSKIADTSEAYEKAVLDPPQSVEEECHRTGSVSPEIVTHKILDGNSSVLPLNSFSKAQEMGNQASNFVLPDLNLPVEEDLCSNPMH